MSKEKERIYERIDVKEEWSVQVTVIAQGAPAAVIPGTCRFLTQSLPLPCLPIGLDPGVFAAKVVAKHPRA